MMETIDPVWSAAPKDLLLADNEVHVWRAQLELPSSQAEQLRDLLTDDEIDRESGQSAVRRGRDRAHQPGRHPVGTIRFQDRRNEHDQG